MLFSVSAQAPNSTITAQTGVGVASTVHLNPMQLMTVDASHARHIQGIQPAPISTQGIQPAPIGTSGIQPAPIGTQGIHSAAPINTQGLQPAAMGNQQPQPEGKTSGKCNPLTGKSVWGVVKALQKWANQKPATQPGIVLSRVRKPHEHCHLCKHNKEKK